MIQTTRRYVLGYARGATRSYPEAMGKAPNAVATIAREASAFALPNHAGGLPNATMEALAVGLPVVVTQVGSAPDVLRDGESGQLVPVRDAGALEVALVKLLLDPERADEMGRRACQTIRTNHDIDEIWARRVIFASRVRRGGRNIETDLTQP